LNFILVQYHPANTNLMQKRTIFITGGTGYLGRFLIPQLIERGHEVTTLVRSGSEKKLPTGARAVTGDALKQATFKDLIKPADTFVQLVGVPHPSPAKAAQFRSIDLVSVRESTAAAKGAGIAHFVYLSVAQPAPIMKVYIEVRAEGERMIRESGMNATFIRPFYVLGPGHRWPYVLMPVFWICEMIPSTRAGAKRLIPVTLKQTLRALVESIENPCAGIRVLEAPQIRTPGHP
jgi:uncharacterized protein YbjT (DUF2867 family)